MKSASLKPLNPDTDAEQIYANARRVHDEMPELVPEIKALVDAGLIDGWRNVVYVGPPRPSPPGAVALNETLVGPWHKPTENKHGNSR